MGVCSAAWADGNLLACRPRAIEGGCHWIVGTDGLSQPASQPAKHQAAGGTRKPEGRCCSQRDDAASLGCGPPCRSTHHFHAVGQARGGAPFVPKAVGVHLAWNHLLLADARGHKGVGHEEGALGKVEARASRAHERGGIAVCSGEGQQCAGRALRLRREAGGTGALGCWASDGPAIWESVNGQATQRSPPASRPPAHSCWAGCSRF